MRCWYGLAALAILGACSSQNDGSDHSFRVFVDDEETVAETTGGPKLNGELFEYEEVLKLNQDDSVEESLLYHPQYFYMDRDGFFFVEDSGNGRIAVFDPDGFYHHSIGRRGEGPGEFLHTSILSITDSTLSVFDIVQSRTSVFWKDGRLIRTVASPFGRSMWLRELYEGPSNTLVLIFLKNLRLGTDYISQREVRILADNGDTLSVIESPPVVTARYQDGEREVIYFTGRSSISYKPEMGIAVCGGGDPFIDVYEVDGTHLRQIRIIGEPDPVPQDVRSDLRADFRYIYDRGNEYWLKHAIIPETMDFSVSMWIDNYNFIWLQKPGYEGETRALRTNGRIPPNMPVCRVLSPEGEYLGDTTIPCLVGRVCFNHFLAPIEDQETGEQRFIVYRIKPAVAGFEYP